MITRDRGSKAKSAGETGRADPEFVRKAGELAARAKARESGYPNGIPVPCKPLDTAAFPAFVRKLLGRHP